MESSKQQQEGCKPATRTHWRRRDPSATAVYVVHPTQFRDIVQQLTGAPASSPAAAARARDQGDSTGNGAGSNAAAQPQREGGASRGEESRLQRTLGQMHQECMAWANSDDD